MAFYDGGRYDPSFAMSNFALLSLVASAVAAWCLTAGPPRPAGLPSCVGRARFAIWSAALAVVLHVVAHDALRDDAFITFRYVDNFVRGNGVVFNAGERVEGYSNFFLLILLAAAHGIVGLPIVGSALAIGYASVIGTVWLCGTYTRSCGMPGAGALAVMLLAGAGSYTAYGASGLESSLFGFGCVAVICAVATGRWGLAGGLAAIATMTRPEGCVLLVACLVGAFSAHGTRLGKTLRVSAWYFVPIGSWTIWRVEYYGYLIPNQVAAKQGMDLDWQLGLGVRYLGWGVVAHFAMALVAGGLVLAVLYRWRAIRSRCLSADVVLVSSTVGFLAFAVFTGGDWMPAFRFLVPAVVMGSLLTVRLWQLAFEHRRLPTWIAPWTFWCVGVAGVSVSLSFDRMMPYVHRQNVIVAGEIEIGRWLARRLPPTTTTAAWANGAIPFCSRLPTIDLLGLTDEHIARRGERRTRSLYPGHAAHDEAYVLERAPDVITHCNAAGLAPAPKDERWPVFRDAYVHVAYEFTRWHDPDSRFANLWIHQSVVGEIAPLLADQGAGIRRVDS